MDVYDSTLPGSAKGQADQGEKGFAKIEVLLEATGGLSLSQVCVVTGLEASTIQNWVKRGWVAHPIGKRYEEIHIARILIINALKDCIKLEHIAKLMIYLNGKAKDGSDAIIKESVLYNYLCEAMKRSGQMGDSSKGGVESVVESVIRDYKSPNPDDRIKLRKALTLMMFACVCTDVKRRTEAMMGQILKELGDPAFNTQKAKPAAVIAAKTIDVEKPKLKPQPAAPRPAAVAATPVREKPAQVAKPAPQAVKPIRITLDDPIVDEAPSEDSAQARKTISQALREWDISSVEKIIIDHDEEARNNAEAEASAMVDEAETKKPVNRPWYIRKNK